ncbi:methyltransferase family protein [Hydrogenispora ethanolica]|uniref:Methyltransferase family protein n=1 Tax=Hydrogenispora ethanolica TaxID=1082276 RepID=A0A4R1RTU6_HYDET|nr:class I SAM-dependent methyltransferase [Hydrogenispora ethanolica]TCL69973.1 methyltransferase family protein [Hydrogenispora ethanolica]
MKPCYLCGEQSFFKRPGSVRDNPDLQVMECRTCGLVFLSSFDHIGEGFYENSQMHAADSTVEDWLRETAADDQRRFDVLQSLMTKKSVLDVGCGNGGFLSRAGRVAATVIGVEPEKRLKPYFDQAQLRVFPHIREANQCFDVITLFHVLEHLPDPISTLKELAMKLNPGGYIIIEVPNANDALLTFYRNEAFSEFTYWSCHLFLFTTHTLELVGKKAGLQVKYIKQTQRYPLSNHLYWLAENKPGGHIQWSFLDSPELHAAYEKQLGLIGCSDTLFACFGVNQDE